jgi:hypothetical protein
MKVIAHNRFRPGVTLDTITPLLAEEVANVWWPVSSVRTTPGPTSWGVVIVFEVPTVEHARLDVEDFPLSRAGYLEWSYLPVQAPLPLESLMDSWVDVAEPPDRTTAIRA